jgi:hypothetical protein
MDLSKASKRRPRNQTPAKRGKLNPEFFMKAHIKNPFLLPALIAGLGLFLTGRARAQALDEPAYFLSRPLRRRWFQSKEQTGGGGEAGALLSITVPQAATGNCLQRAKCDFDLADQFHGLHFAIHDEPCFTCGLEHRLCLMEHRQRAECSDLFHFRHTKILPITPVSALTDCP